MNKHQLSGLLLGSAFLLNNVTAEAIAEENTGCFSITAVSPVKAEPLRAEPQSTQKNKDPYAELRKKNAKVKPYSSEYYENQADYFEELAQNNPTNRNDFLREKWSCLKSAATQSEVNRAEAQEQALKEKLELEAELDRLVREQENERNRAEAQKQALKEKLEWQAEQQILWSEEEATYRSGSPEWCEFKAKLEEAKSKWFDMISEDYRVLIASQNFYLHEAAAARHRLEEARRRRISEGHAQVSDENYRSVRSIVLEIFERPDFSDMNLTDDDLSEIMFYMPQSIKDSLYDRDISGFEADYTDHLISGIRARNWEVFSELRLISVDIVSPAMNSEPETEDLPPVMNSEPEIEDLLKSALKSDLKACLRLLAEDESISEDLKDWLKDEMDSCIDQHLVDIFSKYNVYELNWARQSLLTTGLSYVSDVSFRSYNSEGLATALKNSRWEEVSNYLGLITRYITNEEIQAKWNTIYNPTRDVDPKREFDPRAPFTDREESQVAGLIQGIQREAAIVTTLELIFLKERAKALFDNLLGVCESEDE